METSGKYALSAAFCGILVIGISPAFPQAVGAGPAIGGAGSSIGGTAPIGSPGTVGVPANRLGTGVPSSTVGGLSPGLAGGTGFTTGPGVTTGSAAATPGLVGGLTPSQQSFLMNFSTPGGSGVANVSPAQQMNLNAQANAESALRNSAPFSSTTIPSVPSAPITGNVTGTNTGALGASTTTTNPAPAPLISPPVANNPGTLAETMQPATP